MLCQSVKVYNVSNLLTKGKLVGIELYMSYVTYINVSFVKIYGR